MAKKPRTAEEFIKEQKKETERILKKLARTKKGPASLKKLKIKD